jgi:hypothetical protein
MPKRALAMAIAIATATRVVGDKKGNGASNKKGDGDGNEEGNGNRQGQHGQWLPQRWWRAFKGSNNGDSVKDTAAHAMTGERGMMVVMGHGLCMCVLVFVERPQKIRKRAKL